MKRMLILTLIFMLVPVFMGISCCCAHAAEPVSGASLNEVPCQGCCPEISAAPQQASDLTKIFSVPFFSIVSNVLKALNPDSVQDITANRRAYALAGGEPLVFSSGQPLYLALQTFRI